MRNILKTKHFNPESDWQYVWNNYERFRTRSETETLIQKTVDEVKSVCNGKKAAYAWSGGKDSIALQIVCEDAGIQRGFCCYNSLYFSQSIDFFYSHCPKGVEMYDSGEDIEWLAKHPKFLFPHGTAHHWNVQTHLKYQPIYVRKNNIDILMMGKRTQDGNYVSDQLVYTNSKGVSVYCPIRNWTHEDVICAIRYRGKEISPLYFAKGGGFHYGDTKFAVMSPMKGETVFDAWDRIYNLEPDKVIRSAEAGIPTAIEYMRRRVSHGKDHVQDSRC